MIRRSGQVVSDGGGPNFSSWTDEEVGGLHPGSPDSNETDVVNKYVPVRNTADGGDHDALAKNIATEGVVLVKNEDGILPLTRKGKNMAPKSGFGKIKIGIFGEDAFLSQDGINDCADRGCNKGTLTMGWGSGAADLPYLISPAEALHSNFNNATFQLTNWTENGVKNIDETAGDQDVCFVFINSDAGEGFLSWNHVKGDRNELYAQKGGDQLVRHVAENCDKTIVVLHAVGPTILERWIDLPGVKAVLIAHLPGQESGNAIADIIFGGANPSGRLPYTIAKAEEDYGPNSGILYYPNGVVPQQNFTEGLYFDYRYFDKHNITPRYEFGYGLSYTTFKLNSLMVSSKGVSGPDPKARPKGLQPPTVDTKLPSPESALWPDGMRKLKKYIYPYIEDVSDIEKGEYPYPEGYDIDHPLSNAGGGEGGNPALYEIGANVQASLTNLGSVAGDCVVQLYVEYPENVKDADGEAVDMPVKVLRGFDKIWVDAENSEKRKEVSIGLTRKDLSYWDVKKQNWVMPDGDFKVHLGFSSRDLPVSTSFANSINLSFGSSSKDGEDVKDGGQS